MATTGDPALDRLLQALHGLDDRGAQRLVAQAWAQAEREVVETLTSAIRAVLLRDAAALLERNGVPVAVDDGAAAAPVAVTEPEPEPEPERQPELPPQQVAAPAPASGQDAAPDTTPDSDTVATTSAGEAAEAPAESADGEPEAWYVYGVVDAGPDAGAAVDGAAGVDDDRLVRLVQYDDLAAVTGPVSLAEWAPDALRQRLEDRSWLAERVMAHERVLRACVEAGPVVPMRFATLVTDEAAVRAFLAERADVLRTALADLHGRQEWGAKAFIDWERLRAHLRGGEEPVEGGSEGTTYFARKRSERALRANAQERARDLARTCYDRLAATAERTALLELREPDEDDPQGEGMVLNGAFLVPETALEAFWRTADELSATQVDVGLRIEVTGPWPPYSFVDLTQRQAAG